MFPQLDKLKEHKSKLGRLTMHCRDSVSSTQKTDRQPGRVVGGEVYGRDVGVGEALVRSQKEQGTWGNWVCGEQVIKTFHDIRVCEIPRADHWDHCMEPIFLFLVVVQRRGAAARGVVVVYSNCSAPAGQQRTQLEQHHHLATVRKVAIALPCRRSCSLSGSRRPTAEGGYTLQQHFSTDWSGSPFLLNLIVIRTCLPLIFAELNWVAISC